MKTKYYPDLNAKMSFPEMEKEIIRKWEREDTFKKSIENRQGSEEFVFYDGPPFANGLPHYGHIMVSYVKDVVARYQTMAGKKVERRLGWDCHGLPAEMAAEKELGVSGHKAIEEYGIAKFNDFCRTDVLKYAGLWVDMFKRIGRWVDFKNDYKTMDLPYMESILHNFKSLYDKGLMYEDFRVQPYSWAAQTPVSNFEVNQGYKDKTDTAITVMFKLENGMQLLAWTTTPWTLPSNLMLAVGPDIDYTVMEENGTQYVLATARLGAYKQQLQHAVAVKEIKGSELVGMSYEPLFPHFGHLAAEGTHLVLAGDFVGAEDGTGIVHIAPGFGQDDFVVCRAINPDFPVVCPVDEAGCFTSEIPEYQGRQVFDTNDEIMAELKARGVLVKKEQITHSYPFCWRTDTPLIYKAMSGWFVDVPKFGAEMVALNQEINWTPEHIKNGRFGKWLENAREWSISRNRFWGTPLPVWQSDNPKFPRTDVFGSLAEIKDKTGFEVTDLHRPMIDDVVYPNPDDPSGQTMMRRIPDVFDCWFESGSMPEGQIHYPFQNKEWFENHFPADFIVEAIDQTRGWFYTLHVLGTALHHKPAFKNCMCTGLVMAEGGVKLSKKLKNYPDPYVVLDQMGSDSLRWFFMSSPVLKGGNVALDYDGKEVSKAARKAIMPLWNAFYFFCLYANAEGVEAKSVTEAEDPLDRYILAKLKTVVLSIGQAMNEYDIARACTEAAEFLDILNNWYIRRSRARFWDGGDLAPFNTLYTVLTTLTRAIAPLMPMTAEYVYTTLTNEESVHLADFPNVEVLPDEVDLITSMDLVRRVSSTAKAIREEYRLRNRLPLKTMTIAGVDAPALKDFIEVLKDEVNVKEVVLSADIKAVADTFLYLKTPLIGKRLGAYMKDIMAAGKGTDWAVNADGTLGIAGQTLTAEEFELRLVLKDGLQGQALPDNTAVVQLDTTLYPDLEKEGIARDFVRMVQQARKEADFDVSDRIKLTYVPGTPLVGMALNDLSDYVAEQVLAEEMNRTDVLAEGTVQELGDGTVTFTVEKV